MCQFLFISSVLVWRKCLPRGCAYRKGYSNLAQSKELKENFPVIPFFPHFMIAAIRRKKT
jgi:hypothetical protein